MRNFRDTQLLLNTMANNALMTRDMETYSFCVAIGHTIGSSRLNMHAEQALNGMDEQGILNLIPELVSLCDNEIFRIPYILNAKYTPKHGAGLSPVREYVVGEVTSEYVTGNGNTISVTTGNTSFKQVRFCDVCNKSVETRGIIGAMVCPVCNTSWR